MPGTYDPAAVDPAIGHRRRQMRTELAECRNLPRIGLAYHQSDAVDLDPNRLSIQFVCGQHGCPLCGAQSLAGLVYSDAGSEDERPAQIASAEGDAVTHRADYYSAQAVAAA